MTSFLIELPVVKKGSHPIAEQPLFVTEGMPERFAIPEFSELLQEFAPGIGPEEFMQIADRSAEIK